MNIEGICSRILAHDADETVMIAVDGFGGSGKTTFADKLAKMLGDCYVVHIDDFIVKEKLDENSWDKGGFDRKRLEQQVLKPISVGKSAKFQKLEWASNSLSEYEQIPEVKYVIVEGTTSNHPDIEQYYDFKIWIDTLIEIAKARGQKRDSTNENAKMWDLWAENDRKYMEKHHPDQRSDYICDQSQSK